jgi:hypothetical protein
MKIPNQADNTTNVIAGLAITKIPKTMEKTPLRISVHHFFKIDFVIFFGFGLKGIPLYPFRQMDHENFKISV